MANPEKLKTRLDNVKKALEDAKNNQYDAELALLDAQISQANKHSQRAKEITGNKGFGIAKESRAKKNIEKSEVELKNVEDKLSELENKAGVKKASEVSPETQALADKYEAPDIDGYVVEKSTGKKILATSVLDKEMKNQGQVVDAGGGVMGRAKDGIVNGLGYKEGNANNMLQLGKYAAIAGLVYLRWTKTNGVFEKAAYGLLAYGLLSPCGADLWNIAMNGKSNALNGKGLMAGGAFGGGGAGGEVGPVAQSEVAKNIYLSEYNKLHNPNYAFGMPLYSIFKDQKDILTYVDSATGDFDFAKLLADYNNADGILKGKLNANIIDAEDPQMATTEMFMKFLTGKLTKDGVMLIDPELASVKASLNKNRSEYLKSIGLTAIESNPTLVKSKLDAKKKEIEDLKSKADFSVLIAYGYKVVDGKQTEVKNIINKGLDAKATIKELFDAGYIQADTQKLSSDALLLKGKKSDNSDDIKHIEDVQYNGEKGENAIALMKLEIQEEVKKRGAGLENFDIYNEGGKLYIQNDNRRIELVLQNGRVARLGDFNNDVDGDIVRMMKIGLAMCYEAKYMGLLDQTTTKDKDNKEMVVEKHKFDTFGGNITISDKWFDTGITGSLGKDPIHNATWLLHSANTTEQENNYLAKSLNTLADKRRLGNAVTDKYVAASINKSTNPTTNQEIVKINIADNPGNKMNLESEGSLGEQIRSIVAETIGVSGDIVNEIYKGVKKGVIGISSELRTAISNPNGEFQKWYKDVIAPGSKKLVDITKEGINYLVNATGDVISNAAQKVYEMLTGAVGGTGGDLWNRIHENPAASAIFYGAIGHYIMGGASIAGIPGGIAGGLIGVLVSMYNNSRNPNPNANPNQGKPAK